MSPALQLLILCPLIFVAAFIDSVSGGGGLIALPAYMMVGLPVHNAYANNKLSSWAGLTISSAVFIKNKAVNFKIAIFAMVGALVGAGAGSKLALMFDDRYLKMVLLIALPFIAAYLLFFKKDQVSAPKQYSKVVQAVLSIILGLVIGTYDGFIGPGAGTFYILSLTAVMGLSLKEASGTAKIINYASNTAALAVYLLNGKFMFFYAVPAAISGILGSFVGSRLAIKGGAKIIRPFMLCVLALMLFKLAYDIFNA